jgi:DNA-binding NtrC family response regulator
MAAPLRISPGTSAMTQNQPYRLLVADDQPHILDALSILFRSENFEVETVQSPRLVLDLLSRREFDVLLLDMNYARDTTSGKEGLNLLEDIRKIDSQLPAIVMTAWGTIDLAVRAIHLSARDFIQKPWDDERLLTTVRTYAELYRALRQGQRLDSENKLLRQEKHPLLVAQAPSTKRMVDTIRKVGPSEAAVLITGENGTGKEVVAQTLHSLSPRSDKPLVSVNAGGLSEGTFESELFGHVKGAYTDARTDRIGRFEMAEGGTLFLDEIANISPRQQAKLLRVLQSGEMERVGSSRTLRVDVRVLSATNASLEAECASGNFRIDLLFRLNAVEIRVPPLRERRDDIPVLASYFLSESAARYRKQIQGFSPEVMERLSVYEWPGNVRQLKHAIERAVIMSQSDTIQLDDVGIERPEPSRQPDLTEMSLEEVEALLVGKALSRHGNNVHRAAEALGITRGTFYRRMEKYGLYVPAKRERP